MTPDASSPDGSTYREAGVDTEAQERAMSGIARAVRATFGYHPRAEVVLDIGFFANVLDLGTGPCIAVSTDSTGTKVLVAEMAGRHDTIGIDCVAMNANDVLCVGADPVCMLDFIGISHADETVLDELVEGVRRGCELAECSLPGGEIAQVGELLRGAGDGPHYDVIGTAVGVVDREAVVTGRDVRPGDVVVGIGSSGLHSNGFSLARKVFFRDLGWDVGRHVEELGRALGEELLEPTLIYVREVKKMLQEELEVRGLANITGGGLLNLLRLEAEGVGYELDDLPEPQPVFQILQREGGIPLTAMYETFNMGVGFCVVLPEDGARRALEICEEEGKSARILGRAVADETRRLRLPVLGLEGNADAFTTSGGGRN